MPEQFSYDGRQENNKAQRGPTAPDMENAEAELGEELIEEEQHESAHSNVRERLKVITEILDIYQEHPEVHRKINAARKGPRELTLIEGEVRRFVPLMEQFPPFETGDPAIIEYFQDIEAGLLAWQSPAHTAQEESDFIKATAAHRIIMFSNIGLVINKTIRFKAGSMTYSDVIQEGIIGLNTAIAGFDYTRGLQFSTYATFTIEGQVKRAVANQARLIRISVPAHEAWIKMRAHVSGFRQELGREPTEAELEEKFTKLIDKPTETVRMYNQVGPYELPSLDLPLSSDEGSGTVGDVVFEKESYSERVSEELTARIASSRILGSQELTAKEKLVLILTFGIFDNVPELEVKHSGETLDHKRLIGEAAKNGGLRPKEIIEALDISYQGLQHLRNNALRKAYNKLDNERNANEWRY